MEECIASGSSVGKLGECFFIGLDAKGRHHPEKLFVFPVYASAEGLVPLLKLCIEHGVEFIPVINSAILQLEQKGVSLPLTDLTWGPSAIATREFHAALEQRTQGKAFCLAGDVGRGFHDKYIHWWETIHDMQALGMDPAQELWNRWQPEFCSPDFGHWLARNHTEQYEFLRPVHEQIWNGAKRRGVKVRGTTK